MPQKKTFGAALAVVALGAALSAVAPSAGAATSGARHVSAIGRSGAVQVADDSQLSSIAGYGVNLSAFTSPADWKASMSFVVPVMHCLPHTTDPIFIELFFNGKDKKGNNVGEGGYVIANCDASGQVSYSTNVSAQGGANGGVNGSASAGDKITVSYKASRTAEVSMLTDVTTGEITTQTGSGFASVGGAQFSLQAGFGTGRFPRFTKANFSGAKAGGEVLGSFGPGPMNATDPVGTLKVSAGPIGSNGTSFTDTYVSNY